MTDAIRQALRIAGFTDNGAPDEEMSDPLRLLDFVWRHSAASGLRDVLSNVYGDARQNLGRGVDMSVQAQKVNPALLPAQRNIPQSVEPQDQPGMMDWLDHMDAQYRQMPESQAMPGGMLPEETYRKDREVLYPGNMDRMKQLQGIIGQDMASGGVPTDLPGTVLDFPDDDVAMESTAPAQAASAFVDRNTASLLRDMGYGVDESGSVYAKPENRIDSVGETLDATARYMREAVVPPEPTLERPIGSLVGMLPEGRIQDYASFYTLPASAPEIIMQASKQKGEEWYPGLYSDEGFQNEADKNAPYPIKVLARIGSHAYTAPWALAEAVGHAAKSGFGTFDRALSGEDIPDEEEARASFDLASVAPVGGVVASAIGAVPENAAGMFMTSLGKTADKKALARAKDMKRGLTHRDDIWREEGWGRGGEGKWVSEIDDSGAKITPVEYPALLSDSLNHPELYEAFPDLKNMQAGFADLGPGAYGMSEGLGYDSRLQFSRDMEKPKPTVLHEVMHPLQDVQGLAEGANMSVNNWFQHPEFKPLVKQYYNQIADGSLRKSPTGYALTPEDIAKISTYNGDQIMDLAMQVAAEDLYFRTKGEVAARNVGDRGDMTKAERRAISPWMTQDVPTDRQVISPKDKSSFSLYSNPDEALIPGTVLAGADDPRAGPRALGHFDTPFYHATTHDIKPARGFADPSVTASPYEPGSYHGRAIYNTTSRSDANDNYAGMGPDLTNRVQHRAETIDPEHLDNLDLEYYEKRAEELEEAGVEFPTYTDRLAYAKAYDDLVGKNAEGVTHKLSLNPQNPVLLGEFEGKKPTVFDYNRAHVEEDGAQFVVRDSEGNELQRFDDESEAYDYADELPPTGSGVKLMREVEGLPSEPLGREGSRLFDALKGRIEQELYDGGITAKTFENLIRQADVLEHLYNSDGEMVNPGAALQDIYRAMGYDGVIMPGAENVFPGMNIPPDTTHAAIFDNRRIRDYDRAKYDPAKKDSTNLLSANPEEALLPGIVSRGEDAPMRGYHGTSSPWNGPFDPEKAMAGAHSHPRPYFADNPHEASGYALRRDDTLSGNHARGEASAPNVMSADIDIKNPFNSSMNGPDGYNYIAPKEYKRLTGLKPQGVNKPTGYDVMKELYVQEADKVLPEEVRALRGAPYNPDAKGYWGYIYDEDTARKAWEGVYGRLEKAGYDGLVEPRVPSDYADARSYTKIIPFKRGTVKSATTGETLFSNADEAGIVGAAMATAKRELDRNNMYSPSLEAAKGLKQEKGTVEQFRSQIIKNGGKEKELQAVGFDKAFPDKSAKVSRADIENFLRENRIDLGETIHGFPIPRGVQDAKGAERFELYQRWQRGEIDTPTYEAAERSLEQDQFHRGPVHDVKFESYSTPGGIPGSYREVVTTYRDPEHRTLEARRNATNAEMRRIEDEHLAAGNEVSPPEYRELSAKRNKMEERMSEIEGQEYTSSHWPGITNPLLHYRTKDFPGVEGSNTRVLDELQSDWAQRARDQGTRDPAALSAVQGQLATARRERDAAHQEVVDFIKNTPAFDTETGPIAEIWERRNSRAFEGVFEPESTPAPDLASFLHEVYATPDALPGGRGSLNEQAFILGNKLLKYQDVVNDLVNKENAARNGVPSAPFISNTSDWVDLGLKQALVDAARDPSVSRLAWAPGKVQADRYGLEKQVDSLRYRRNDDGTINLHAAPIGRPHDGTDLGNVRPEEMDQYVGRELANKIRSAIADVDKANENKTLKQRPIGVINNADLKVGGEGMKSFYGDMTPEGYQSGIVGTRLQKLVKGLDPEAARVEPTVIPHPMGSSKTVDNRSAVNLKEMYPDRSYPSIPITETLRKKILEDGLPMFVNGFPIPLAPDDDSDMFTSMLVRRAIGQVLP